MRVETTRRRTVAGLWAALVCLAVTPATAQTTSTQAPANAEQPLTFQAAMALAAANNLDVAAVRHARAIRQAEVRAAGQWANPEFSSEVTRDTPHGDLAIGMPLDIGGVRSRRIAAATEALTMADVDEAAAFKDLRRRLRVAFYGVLAADEQVALADGALKVAERVKEVAQARFEEGAAPRLDVMAADLGIVRARVDRDLARSSRRASQADLNALLNRPPGMTVTLAGAAADVPPLPTLDAATAAALRSNVDLLAIDREIAVETRRLDVLKAERVPTPTFTFGTALDAPGEFDVGPHAGVSLTIPLFSRNQGEIAGSLARTDTAQTRRDALRRQVEASVYAAIERVTAQRAQVEAFRTELVPTATTIEELAEESYRLGRDPILMALAAQRSLKDLRSEYVQALLALQTAIADLEDSLGAPIK